MASTNQSHKALFSLSPQMKVEMQIGTEYEANSQSPPSLEYGPAHTVTPERCFNWSAVLVSEYILRLQLCTVALLPSSISEDSQLIRTPRFSGKNAKCFFDDFIKCQNSTQNSHCRRTVYEHAVWISPVSQEKGMEVVWCRVFLHSHAPQQPTQVSLTCDQTDRGGQ